MAKHFGKHRFLDSYVDFCEVYILVLSLLSAIKMEFLTPTMFKIGV